MGSGALFSHSYGKGGMSGIRKNIFNPAVISQMISGVGITICFLIRSINKKSENKRG